MAAGLEQIVSAVEGLGVAPRAELLQLCADHHVGAGDSTKLLKLLVKRGSLTRFQANALHHGLVKALTIGDYLVLEKLGSGGMGDVYKAQHRRMKRVVAIKLLPAAATRNPLMVRRFYREVEAAGKLIHPHIVTAYDAGEHHSVHYLVMEYVPGRDLGSRVKESGPLPLKQALECIVQAGKGLVYAHQYGVIHRDIKPANLILTDDGVVKILDMGLARIEQDAAQHEHSLTGDGTMGTPDYMAPEQALNAKHADHRSDIYSLGCTLYRLATGNFPFAGSTLMEKLMAQREAPPPSLCAVLPDCPPRLEQAFQTMLAKQPEHRFQSMAEVVTELEQCAALLSASPIESDLAALALAMAAPAAAASRPIARPFSSSAAREPSSLVTLEDTGQPGSTLLRLHAKAAGPQHARSRRSLLLGGAGAAVLLLSGVLTFWPSGDDIQESQRSADAAASLSPDDRATASARGPDAIAGTISLNPPTRASDVPAFALTEAAVLPDSDKPMVLAISSDGQTLVSGHWGPPRINLWRTDGMQLLHTWRDLPDAISRLDISSDGKWIVSATENKPGVHVWDAQTHELAHTFETTGVWGIDLSDDDRQLAVTLVDGYLKVFELETGRLVKSSYMDAGPWAVQWSPDSRRLAVATKVGVAILAHDREEPLAMLSEVGLIHAVAFSPADPRLLVIGGRTPGVRDEESEPILSVWDWQSGKLIKRLPVMMSHVITAVAFSKDGGLLVTATDEPGCVQIWDTKAWQELARGEKPGWRIRDALFTPDGKSLFSSIHGIVRWDISPDVPSEAAR